MSKSGVFFYILTYINFRQTNAINTIFYASFMLRILQQTKEFSSHAILQILKIIKNLKKKNLKKHEKYQNLELFFKF